MRSAVLVSGGLDSDVLLIEESTRADVQPIYVSVGLAWEQAEREMLKLFLASSPVRSTVTRPLVVLSVDMSDVYAATHWAIQGRPPGYHTPDEDVYLPGRNVVLVGKASVYCAAAGIGRLVLGTLAGNPFPDATAEFRSAMARALSLGLGHPIDVDAPYARMSKADVVRQAVSLGVPLELTLSCMNPRTGSDAVSNESTTETSTPIHCGLCSKCRERHDAFLDAEIADATTYADRTHITFLRSGH